MDQQRAIQAIDTFLHDRLKDTGDSGFEGLIAILAQQATGQEFRLSTSGRQSGRDAASESGYANSIKIEAKHYRKKTALKLRELNAEIDEATESDPNLDIWILAASRFVGEQISNSLDKHAESLGVEVVLLDLGVNGLPRVAVLMAAFPTQVPEECSGPRYTRKIAEARAFSGVAPHLTSSEFIRRLIHRPGQALDLVSLELWFAPIPRDEEREAIALLHTPSDEATLRRILWVLPRLEASLSEPDRDRLVQLAGSEDAMARSGAMRVAIDTQDDSVGRRIADLGRSADKDTGPFEEHWLTVLLARYGDHLPLGDIAKRLRPSAIGLAIDQRGNPPNEVDTYARCLDQEWQQIVSAVDPDIERLPEIAIDTDPTEKGARLPELRETSAPRTIRFGRSNSWTSGPPIDPPSELKKLFSTWDEEKIGQLNQDRRRAADAILAAWRTDTFQWYGRGFSFQAMDLLYRRHPTPVERWIQPALADSLTGFSVRVRLGSFLEPICRVLLNRNPRLGLQLWKILHKREDNPIVFDTCDIAFCAQDSTESKLARRAVFDECWNDASIARVALTCNRWKRQDWLDEVIEQSISAGRLWRRAKGLTLASLSDITPPRFEELVSKAAVGHTWVEESLAPLRENVRRNRLARYWYSVFLGSEDPDAAWGALQLVLALADERFLNWRVEVEKECAGCSTTEKRLRFLSLGWESRRGLLQEIGREDARKELLFGLKIQRGEIVPFMES